MSENQTFFSVFRHSPKTEPFGNGTLFRVSEIGTLGFQRSTVFLNFFDSFQVPVLNMVGAYSPFVEETVVLNGKLNPENTNWMKIQVHKQPSLYNPSINHLRLNPPKNQ